MQDVNDLGLMVDSRIPIIVLESFDEQRALEMLTRVAISRQLPVFCWSITSGLKRLGFGSDVRSDGDGNPEPALLEIKDNPDPAIYVLCDFHPYLNDPRIVRHIKDIALAYGKSHHTLVLLSHGVEVPPELLRLSATMRLALPNDEQLQAMVREEAKVWGDQNRGLRVRTDTATLNKLVANLRGVSFADARRLIRGAIRDDGAITDDDLPALSRAKFSLLDMQGVLSFEYDTASFASVGGLHHLKRWLEERRDSFLMPDAKIDPPKGLMLLGVQGGGKSLAARAVAGLWGLPLLRLDMGALYNKFIGETEKNLREALQLADSMAPCVLWMDEIEKSLAGGSNDEGTSRRIMGTLLTWMAERKSRVFIVATANAVHELPPELLRKGRLDEIFFVDLPDLAVREVIFRIHLDKRHHTPDGFDLVQLAELSEGFSGAEIEQAVVSAMYTAAARDERLATDHIVSELAQTSPLSVVMAEKVAALRAWAAERTVSAG